MSNTRTPHQILNIRDNATYFEILGLTPSDPPQEVEKAWRKLATKYHPDKALLNQEEGGAVIKLINNAHDEIKFFRSSINEIIGFADWSTIQNALKKGKELNSDSLDVAIKTKNLEIVQGVKGSGGSITTNSLRLAINTLSAKIVEFILSAIQAESANSKHKRIFIKPNIMLAIETNQVEIVKVFTTNKKTSTYFHPNKIDAAWVKTALENQNIDIFRIITGKISNLDENYLCIAIENKTTSHKEDLKFISLILGHYLSLTNEPLNRAIKLNNIEIVKMVAPKVATVHFSLKLAMEVDVEIFKILLSFSLKEMIDASVLDAAIKTNKIEIVQALINHCQQASSIFNRNTIDLCLKSNNGEIMSIIFPHCALLLAGYVQDYYSGLQKNIIDIMFKYLGTQKENMFSFAVACRDLNLISFLIDNDCVVSADYVSSIINSQNLSILELFFKSKVSCSVEHLDEAISTNNLILIKRIFDNVNQRLAYQFLFDATVNNKNKTIELIIAAGIKIHWNLIHVAIEKQNIDIINLFANIGRISSDTLLYAMKSNNQQIIDKIISVANEGVQLEFLNIAVSLKEYQYIKMLHKTSLFKDNIYSALSPVFAIQIGDIEIISRIAKLKKQVTVDEFEHFLQEKQPKEILILMAIIILNGFKDASIENTEEHMFRLLLNQGDSHRKLLEININLQSYQAGHINLKNDIIFTLSQFIGSCKFLFSLPSLMSMHEKLLEVLTGVHDRKPFLLYQEAFAKGEDFKFHELVPLVIAEPNQWLATIQNERGDTLLHVIARKLASQSSIIIDVLLGNNDFLQVLKLLRTSHNIKNKTGFLPCHYLLDHASFDLRCLFSDYSECDIKLEQLLFNSQFYQLLVDIFSGLKKMPDSDSNESHLNLSLYLFPDSLTKELNPISLAKISAFNLRVNEQRKISSFEWSIQEAVSLDEVKIYLDFISQIKEMSNKYTDKVSTPPSFLLNDRHYHSHDSFFSNVNKDKRKFDECLLSLDDLEQVKLKNSKKL